VLRLNWSISSKGPILLQHFASRAGSETSPIDLVVRGPRRPLFWALTATRMAEPIRIKTGSPNSRMIDLYESRFT
jgi:hypothetical protein